MLYGNPVHMDALILIAGAAKIAGIVVLL